MRYRLWASGCSSGEEAYSLAIALLEFLGENAVNTRIQLFGTDLSESAIEQARAGFYPESSVAAVSPERLRRFFSRVEGGYRINKAIREMCVFARHNIFADPPFSHMDLISCRNVLIYMDSVLQKQVMPIFHYALNPGGFLMLGSSEGIGSFRISSRSWIENTRSIRRSRSPERTVLISWPMEFLPLLHGEQPEYRGAAMLSNCRKNWIGCFLPTMPRRPCLFPTIWKSCNRAETLLPTSSCRTGRPALIC